jgi:FKBP-type peptidyl-prolyl cis-trans isomerase FkpA
MRSVRLLVLIVIVLAGTTGCVGSASPTRTPVYNQTDLLLGSGDEAVVGRVVTVNYTGWIFDPLRPEQKGAVFDSSLGRAPFVFTLGAGSVIAGWERGVPGMRVGGIRRLLIPPSLGYGATRTGALPPYASLVFEIEMLSVATSAQASR